MHLSKVSQVFKSSLYDLFSMNYANELLGSYLTCIFTMYVITFLTSLKQMHGIASYFLCMFLGWTPTFSSFSYTLE